MFCKSKSIDPSPSPHSSCPLRLVINGYEAMSQNHDSLAKTNLLLLPRVHAPKYDVSWVFIHAKMSIFLVKSRVASCIPNFADCKSPCLVGDHPILSLVSKGPRCVSRGCHCNLRRLLVGQATAPAAQGGYSSRYIIFMGIWAMGGNWLPKTMQDWMGSCICIAINCFLLVAFGRFSVAVPMPRSRLGGTRCNLPRLPEFAESRPNSTLWVSQTIPSWGVPYMGLPKNGWFIRENPI